MRPKLQECRTRLTEDRAEDTGKASRGARPPHRCWAWFVGRQRGRRQVTGPIRREPSYSTVARSPTWRWTDLGEGGREEPSKNLPRSPTRHCPDDLLAKLTLLGRGCTVQGAIAISTGRVDILRVLLGTGTSGMRRAKRVRIKRHGRRRRLRSIDPTPSGVACRDVRARTCGRDAMGWCRRDVAPGE